MSKDRRGPYSRIAKDRKKYKKWSKPVLDDPVGRMFELFWDRPLMKPGKWAEVIWEDFALQEHFGSFPRSAATKLGKAFLGAYLAGREFMRDGQKYMLYCAGNPGGRSHHGLMWRWIRVHDDYEGEPIISLTPSPEEQ